MATAVLGVAIVVTLVVLRDRGDDRGRVATLADSSPTTTTSSTTTTSPTSTTATTVIETPTSSAPVTSSTRATPPPTQPTLPAGNQPLTVHVTADQTTIGQGQTATLTAVLRDTDAPPRGGCVIWQYDSGYGPFFLSYGKGTDGPCIGDPPPCDGEPSPDGGTASDSVTFTPDPGFVGDVTFTAFGTSHEPSCRYDSKGEASITVHVTG